MTKRMLIDATHAEETRVVVLDGNRLEDFDVETSTKRQLKGNIYLAKVVRVEPSLQAAFVEYGGNRHGFLAFGEIHPDYYQIPVADRQRLLDMQAEEAREEEEEEDRAAAAAEAHGASAEAVPEASRPARTSADEAAPRTRTPVAEEASAAQPAAIADRAEWPPPQAEPDAADRAGASLSPSRSPAVGATRRVPPRRSPPPIAAADEPTPMRSRPIATSTPSRPIAERSAAPPSPPAEPTPARQANGPSGRGRAGRGGERRDSEPAADLPPPETVGGDGDDGDEARDRRIPPRFLRNYKIQEVIQRRQILLVQVVKEERGTKGAALTTYLSLAGRYLCADAELASRRRHLPQDHLCGRPATAEGNHGRARDPARHGAHRAHRGSQPAEARDQA